MESCSTSPEGVSQISLFFQDKNVFITGVTGFIGKVLLEKLLRSCKGIKTIYVLLRAKKDKTPQQRLEQLLSCQLLDAIRKECPDALAKVVPIVGDVTLPNLGVGEVDGKLLATVHVVFHCAATVRFDEPLKRAVDINLCGTGRVLELCRQMTNLVSLVYVSTAYCFCNRTNIEEKVYPEQYSQTNVAEATVWMTEDILELITPHFLDGRPSTYHLTKALSENLLVEKSGDVNVTIIRPSIVTASYREPLLGWIDSYNGLSGFIVVAGKGVIRTMMVHKNVAADIVPVDIVINTMIAAAWHLGTQRSKGVVVYNCTSGSRNKLTWGDINQLCHPNVIRYPSMEVFRYPGGSLKTNKMWHLVCQLVEHFLPAYIVDFLAWATGNKPGMVKLYKKIHGAIGVLEYFTTKEWTFANDNVVMLRNQLTEEDKKAFDFDMEHVDWTVYMENFVRGIRRYLLHEDDSTIPAARRKLRMVYYCWKGIHLALIASVYGLLKQTTLLDSIWETVTDLL